MSSRTKLTFSSVPHRVLPGVFCMQHNVGPISLTETNATFNMVPGSSYFYHKIEINGSTKMQYIYSVYFCMCMHIYSYVCVGGTCLCALLRPCMHVYASIFVCVLTTPNADVLTLQDSNYFRHTRFTIEIRVSVVTFADISVHTIRTCPTIKAWVTHTFVCVYKIKCIF